MWKNSFLQLGRKARLQLWLEGAKEEMNTRQKEDKEFLKLLDCLKYMNVKRECFNDYEWQFIIQKVGSLLTCLKVISAFDDWTIHVNGPFSRKLMFARIRYEES
jgi:hypothetical protein